MTEGIWSLGEWLPVIIMGVIGLGVFTFTVIVNLSKKKDKEIQNSEEVEH